MPSSRSEELPTARPRAPRPPSFAPRSAARLPAALVATPREQIAPGRAGRRQQTPPGPRAVRPRPAPSAQAAPSAQPVPRQQSAPRPARGEHPTRGTRRGQRPPSPPVRRGVGTPPSAIQPPRRRRGRRVRGVVIGVLVALAGAGIAWGTGQGRAPEEPPRGLDPIVRERFDAAVSAAAGKGVEMWINSGWRSAQEQQAIFDDAVATHGSAREAARWVLPPERSAHVQGTAIDVGPAAGAAWLAKRSAKFGLCRVYSNEPWHFEPLVEPGGKCPPVIADATK